LDFQGNVDQNGDGHTDDEILHIYDALTGVVSSAGIRSQPLDLQGRRILAFHDEQQDSVDLNGDQDDFDYVVQIVDAGTGALTNLGLTGNPDHTRFLDSGVLVPVFEIFQGSLDLNGDGDACDSVLVLVDPDGGSIDSLRLAVTELGLPARIERRWLLTLDLAAWLEGRGLTRAATWLLRLFRLQIETRAGGVVTHEQTAALIAHVQQVIDQLNGEGGSLEGTPVAPCGGGGGGGGGGL
jgi:hypothetical protein